jgi:hypothetical protein
MVNMLQFVKTVQRMQAMADLRSGLNLKLTAECATDEDARRLNDAVRGLLGFARLQTGEDAREVLRAYDSIRPSFARNTVTITVDLSQDQLEKLGAKLERLAGPSSSRKAK